MHSGRPTLVIDGQAVPPLMYGLSDIPASRAWTDQARRNIANFAAAGIDLVQIDLALRDGWRPEGEFDLAIPVRELQNVMEVSPDAAIFIRLHLNPPHWWMKANPAELVVYADGPAEDQGEPERLIARDCERMMRVSLASDQWLTDAGAKLAEFCRHLAALPEGANVVGIQVACGMYGEWHYWGICNEPDYSPAMTNRFRRFLKEKYGNDQALREAWRQPEAELSTAGLPGVEERNSSADLPFRHPGSGHRAIDAIKCLQDSVAQAIVFFSRIIKQNWPRPVVTGAFYGYFFDTGIRAALSGHLEVETVLNSPYVDYLCGPHVYDSRNREPGGPGNARGILESVRLHGKLWLTEMDEHPVGTETCAGGDPARRSETIAKMQRSILGPLLHGMGAWYYDHRIVPSGDIYNKTGWWDHPVLMAEVNREYNWYKRYALTPFTPAADVALVVDTQVYYHLVPTLEHNTLLPFISDDMMIATSHAGVAYDCLYLDDLELVDWSRYRCVVMVNTFVLNRKYRDLIKSRIARNGRHLVWLYAPGYSDDEQLDVNLIGDMTGIRVKRVEPGRTMIISGGALPSGRCENPRMVAPLFAVDDPRAEPLAAFAHIPGDAGARRVLPESTSWFFSLPPSDPAALRAIFRQSGAHIYSDAGDAVNAGGNLLLVHSVEGGPRTLHFPNGRITEITLPPCSTTCFELETGTEISTKQ